jgi:D-amino-acid dehydrogenase
VSDTWLGFRPTLPDSLPVIGRSKQNPNLIFAFGHHHLGLTLGGITGKLVSEIAAGATPSLDVTPFRPDRFS